MPTFCNCETCRKLKKEMEKRTKNPFCLYCKEILEETSNYFLDVADNKYSVYQNKDGSLHALRHGVYWQDLTGNNLVFNLMIELLEAKEKIQKVLNEFPDIDCDANDKNYLTLILKGEIK